MGLSKAGQMASSSQFWSLVSLNLPLQFSQVHAWHTQARTMFVYESLSIGLQANGVSPKTLAGHLQLGEVLYDFLIVQLREMS